MEDNEVSAILNQPNRSRIEGQRDHALLAVLYNTGARIQEALNITPRALRNRIAAARPGHRARLKGADLLSLAGETVALLKAFLKRKQPRGEDETIFVNRYGRPLGAAGVRFKLKHYLEAAGRQYAVAGSQARHSAHVSPFNRR